MTDRKNREAKEPPELGIEAAELAKAEADRWEREYAARYGEWRTSDAEAQLQFNKNQFWEAEAKWRKAASTPTPQPLVIADDLANVRAVAKEWLAAALTLFGLFSFTSIFFGQDALNQLDGHPWFTGVFLLCGGLAVITAALAIGVGTRAAHGWPKRQRKPGGALFGSPKKERTEHEDAAKKMECARDDLKSSVAFLGVSLALTIVAVAMVVMTHLYTAPVPQEVDLLDASGGRVACGLVMGVRVSGDDSKKQEIGVTPKDDGAVTWYDLDTVAKSQVRPCP